MPRPGPRRPAVSVRLDPDQADWLATQATAGGVSQGHIIRGLISRAMAAARRKVTRTSIEE